MRCLYPIRKLGGGKRYDFVRFFNMGDERMMKTKLDNIFLDGRKIFANIPKFGRSPNNTLYFRPNINGGHKDAIPSSEKTRGWILT